MLKHPHLDDWLDQLERWVDGQEMDVLKADAAQTAILTIQEAIVRLSEQRRAAVRGMASQGYSQREIARELNVSRARIDQILK